MKLAILFILALLRCAASFDVASMKGLIENEYFKRLQDENLSEGCSNALGNVSSMTLIKRKYFLVSNSTQS